MGKISFPANGPIDILFLYQEYLKPSCFNLYALRTEHQFIRGAVRAHVKFWAFNVRFISGELVYCTLKF